MKSPYVAVEKPYFKIGEDIDNSYSYQQLIEGVGPSPKNNNAVWNFLLQDDRHISSGGHLA